MTPIRPTVVEHLDVQLQDEGVIETISTGIVATMNSPVFRYDPPQTWLVDEQGAQPQEPPNPDDEPSGVVSFTYTGRELALELLQGYFWGYLFITVDGEPANLLPTVADNRNSQGDLAGYYTFQAPEKQANHHSPVPRWVRVHVADTHTQHTVRIEVWRSWGLKPLQAVAIDGLPTLPLPFWPIAALLVVAFWCGVMATMQWVRHKESTKLLILLKTLLNWVLFPAQKLAERFGIETLGILTTVITAALLAVSVLQSSWLLCLLGLGLIAYIAVLAPIYWMALLLLGLPFYYRFALPILPNRLLNLIDVGLLGGIVIVVLHQLYRKSQTTPATVDGPPSRSPSIWGGLTSPYTWLALLISWALISVFAADYTEIALREWRTVFLAGGLSAILLGGAFQGHNRPKSFWILVNAWLLGGSVVGLVGIWQYVSGDMLISAEDVYRVRAFYGSPNNLAIYLERTVAVGLALTVFLHNPRHQGWFALLTLPQLIALRLTYSRGGLFLAMPMMLLVLLWGGWYLLSTWQRQREDPNTGILSVARPISYHRLWWLVAIVVITLLTIFPSTDTVRFQQTLDFNQGTGFLRRQLWQSAWAMAQNHPLFGVGPDHFLYAFRNEYILPIAWKEPNLNHPHNWGLDFWTRLGVPGLLIGIGFLTTGMMGLGRLLRRAATQQPNIAVLSLGLIAAAFAALAHGTIDISYALPDLMLVWVFLFYLPQLSVGR
ncbi:MAG: O-antigen ligase family protein [Chloroflexota bacterium]